jgi:hypothetical protein
MSTVRSPSGPRITRRASTAAQTAERSSAGSASIANDRVGDHPFGIREDRQLGRHQLGLEQLAVPRHRPDPDLVRVLADVAEVAGEVVDVDQVLRRSEAKLHHRQERMTAGQQARLGTQPGQQLERVLDARCPFVLERCGNLHDVLSRPTFEEGATGAGALAALSSLRSTLAPRGPSRQPDLRDRLAQLPTRFLGSCGDLRIPIPGFYAARAGPLRTILTRYGHCEAKDG